MGALNPDVSTVPRTSRTLDGASAVVGLSSLAIYAGHGSETKQGDKLPEVIPG